MAQLLQFQFFVSAEINKALPIVIDLATTMFPHVLVTGGVISSNFSMYVPSDHEADHEVASIRQVVAALTKFLFPRHQLH